MGGHIGERQYNSLTKTVWSRDGIGLEHPMIRAQQDARLGSVLLGGAIRDLLSQMPDRKVEEVLGKAPVREPGTERVYRGQGAQRSLAA